MLFNLILAVARFGLAELFSVRLSESVVLPVKVRVFTFPLAVMTRIVPAPDPLIVRFPSVVSEEMSIVGVEVAGTTTLFPNVAASEVLGALEKTVIGTIVSALPVSGP